MTEPTPPRLDAAGGDDDADSPFTIEDTGSTIDAADLTDATRAGPTDRRLSAGTAAEDAVDDSTTRQD